MKSFILFLFLINLSITSFAQSENVHGKISLTINNETNAALEGVTVELRKAADSALLKTAISEKNGAVEFENLKEGSYLVKASIINHQIYWSQPITINQDQLNISLPVIQLSKSAAQLTGVTVTASKPFIQRLSDRLVVNVESSMVSAGSSAIDVLERSPGITIDQNDIISLRGRAGVIIMIDGKPTPMSGADLANYLRGLPSNAIERIEIITNPSAKYDAAGNSGIIDIRLKKDQKLGTNGTFTAGVGHGKYPKANTGGTFNYRNKKVNVFGNYNYSYRGIFNHLVINRNFFENGVFTGSDDKDNFAEMAVSSNNARLGADFFPSKNTIIGFVVNSSFNNFKRDADISTMVNDRLTNPLFKFLTVGTDRNKNNNAVANINFKQKLNATGRELTADLDYGTFSSLSLTRTASAFYELDGAKKLDDEILDGDQEGALTFKTGKVDYVNPIKGGGKFEAGFKTSYVSSDNDAKFFNVFSSGSVVDDSKTNRFYYEEYNNAGYVNYSREFKKWNFQVGLRGEQTNIKTKQVKGDKRFKNDYFEPFPSAFVNYKLKEDQTIGLSVSRRIDRPGYSQLNPFIFQIDATIYSTGEPHLRPQMTWSYEGNYTIKNMNFTLGYSHTKDPQNMVLSRILDVIPTFEIKPGQDSNITVQKPVNLNSSDYIGFTATTPIRISKWWNMINNLNIFYNHFNGNIGGAQLNNGAPAANIRTNNTFTFKKGWSAEFIANLNTGGRYGYMVTQPQWGIALGGQKNIMEGKGTIRFNVTDIFWTNLPKAKVTYEGRYVENWHAFRETRVANLSFTYRFGNSKVQAARRRTTASEEETRRAGGN